jgi:hypothetical protein
MKTKMFFIPKERQKFSEKLKEQLIPNSPHIFGKLGIIINSKK